MHLRDGKAGWEIVKVKKYPLLRTRTYQGSYKSSGSTEERKGEVGRAADGRLEASTCCSARKSQGRDAGGAACAAAEA